MVKKKVLSTFSPLFFFLYLKVLKIAQKESERSAEHFLFRTKKQAEKCKQVLEVKGDLSTFFIYNQKRDEKCRKLLGIYTTKVLSTFKHFSIDG